MTLIIILCALFTVKFTNFFRSVRADNRLIAYMEYFTQKIGNNRYMAIFIVLLVAVGLTLVAQLLLMSFAFGFFGWLFSLLLLIYCLEEVRFSGKSVPVFYQEVLQASFSVIFWFVLLGPAACFAYRLLQRLSISSKDPLTQRFSLWLVCLLDWMPARLLALSFSFSSWRQVFNTRLPHTYEVLYCCGRMDVPQALVNRAWVIWLVVLALLFVF